MHISIYKIVNNIDDRVYIGFTQQPLYKRWNDHKKRWRKPELTQYTSKVLFDAFGINNCKIVLEDTRDVENIEIAKKIEREFIDKYRERCVNIQMPYKTIEEKTQDKNRYLETRRNKLATIEYSNARNARVCCILCKTELSKACLVRHRKLKHTI